MTPEQIAALVQVLRDGGPVALAVLMGWIAYRFFLESKEKDGKIAAMYEERLEEAREERQAALNHQKQVLEEMGKFREVLERYERRLDPP